jgi:hypothetical protein
MPEPAHDAVDRYRDRRAEPLAANIEWVCWFVPFYAAILRWINGAAVSVDQLVVQAVVVSLALAAAFGLRLRRILARHKSGRSAP